MALVPLKKIAELTNGRTAYLKGISLYNSGWVGQVTRASRAEYSEYITARVEEDGRSNAVEIGLSAQGDVSYMSCDCASFQEGEGACRHVAAVLVHKYYADMVSGLSTAGQMMRGPAPMRTRSDDAARRMMQRYMTREAAELMATGTGPDGLVDLRATLDLRGRRPRLTFTVGNRRAYVIKDISQFCSHMAVGATASYGKQLEFIHHPASFTEESRPLLRFLRREYADLQAQQQAANPYACVKLAREMPLTPGGLDRFFDLFVGQVVDIREEAGTHTVRLVEENPALTIQIDPPESGGGLVLTTGDIKGFQGAAHLYVLYHGRLYRCGAEYTSHMAEWIFAAQDAPSGLFLAQADLASFCSGVLPVIRPYIRLEGEADQLLPYYPRPLETRIYLDASDPVTITARVECWYGEDCFPLYDDGEQASFRDRLGELRVRLTLQRYFTAYLPESGLLVFHGDDDVVYRFLESGMAELEQMATVFVTDAFKRIGLISPPRVQVGVRLLSDLLELETRVDDLPPEEISGILDSYRQKKKYHRLKSGSFIQIEDTALASLAELADGLGLTDQELRSGLVRVPRYRALYLDKVLREQDTVRFQRDGAFRAMVRHLKEVADSEFAVPDSLTGILRNYQKTGYRWLRTMETAGFGGILADDMGLGKTVQMIALLMDARQRGERRPSLVVCPTSLVLNWEAEIRKFAPELRVLLVIGDAAQRAEILRASAGVDVVITSYDLLKRDIALYEDKAFQYHILDEAQAIKNHMTQNAKAVKAITSDQRFALTGTPIENRLSELWSLFDFLMPGFLFSYTRFRQRFELPIVRNADEQALARLSRMVQPFILRRLKKDVLRELPPKTERLLMATMEEEQSRLYRANVAQVRQEIRQEAAQGRLEKNRLTILAMLTRLRQLCCDPSLCYEEYAGGSCKLEACLDLIREAAETGHKVLLFSQFTSMLEIIERRLEKEQIASYTLRGSTSKERRAALVDTFNRDDTPVFLISLKAGGTGLNLTGADIVIHYDPWWNVSAQNQATDRAHRIGQQNPVQVIRLIAQNTIEEKILRLQESKKELADAVIREGENPIAALTAEQLLDILE